MTFNSRFAQFRKNNILNPIVVARDGAEALDYLFGPQAADRELPAVVLLDLKLPKVDGIDVLRRIRAAQHEVLAHRGSDVVA